MPTNMAVTRTRLERLLDERVTNQRLHEDLLQEAEGRDDSRLTEAEAEQAAAYRTRQHEIDDEVRQLYEALEQEEQSAAVSQRVRSHLNGTDNGVINQNGQVVYRTFAAYARDRLVAQFPSIAMRAGGETVRQAARERLARTPDPTVSSDVEGLISPAYIGQIMDIINARRPVVATARTVNLSNGKLTWPKITQRPTVAKQDAEKTEASSQTMTVTMEDDTADTYLGSGNLSWQAINWTTPDALALWFQLAGEAYAQQTEAAACGVLADAASTIMSGALAGGGGDSFADWITAVLNGISQIYDATGATPDTLYMAPDMFFAAAAVTSDTGAALISAGQLNLAGLSGTFAGLRVVASAGFDSGQAVVGDSSAFLVGETAGAPVELRAVEPAIGGMEVGVIGAFKAISFDDDRFADIGPTT